MRWRSPSSRVTSSTSCSTCTRAPGSRCAFTSFFAPHSRIASTSRAVCKSDARKQKKKSSERAEPPECVVICAARCACCNPASEGLTAVPSLFFPSLLSFAHLVCLAVLSLPTPLPPCTESRRGGRFAGGAQERDPKNAQSQVEGAPRPRGARRASLDYPREHLTRSHRCWRNVESSWVRTTRTTRRRAKGPVAAARSRGGYVAVVVVWGGGG